MKIALTRYDEEDQEVVSVDLFDSTDDAIQYAKDNWDGIIDEEREKELKLTGKTSWEMYNDGLYSMRVTLVEVGK